MTSKPVTWREAECCVQFVYVLMEEISLISANDMLNFIYMDAADCPNNSCDC